MKKRNKVRRGGGKGVKEAWAREKGER